MLWVCSVLENRVQIREVPAMSIRRCCRSVCNHVFLLVTMLFLFLLYRSFPSLFFILISFSPVLVCTLLLLGILLCFGALSVSEIENDEMSYAYLKGESFSIDKCRTFQEDSGKTISIFRALPFLLGMSCFFFIVYILLPFLVSILVSLSPVVVCAAILVGVIVSFGERNTSESDSVIQEEYTIIPHAVPEDNEAREDVTSVRYGRSLTREMYTLKRDEGKRVEEYELSMVEKLEDLDESMASWKVKCEKWLSQEVQFRDQGLEFEDENPKEQNSWGDEEWCIAEMEEEGARVGNDRLLLDYVTNQAGLEAVKHAGHHHYHAQEGSEIINKALDSDDCWLDSLDSFSNFPSNKVDYGSSSVLKHIGKRNHAGRDTHDSKKLEDSTISEAKKHEILNNYTSPSTSENSRKKSEHVPEVPSIAKYPEGLSGHVSAVQIHDQEDIMKQYHCCIGAEVCESIEEVQYDELEQEVVVTADRVPQVEDTMKMIGSTEEIKYKKDGMNQHQLVSDMGQGPGNSNTSKSVDSDSYQDANDNADQNDGDNNSGAESDKQGSYRSAMTWGENDEKNHLCHENHIETGRAPMNMNAMAKKKLVDQVNAGNLYEHSSISTTRCSLPSISSDYDLPPILDSAPPTLLLNQDPVDLPINPTEEKTDHMEDGSENAVMIRHQRQETSFLHKLYWQEERPTFICSGCKQKFMMPHQKNTLFRRVKSFEILPSGDYRQESLEVSKPFFVGEKLASEGAKVTPFRRFSEFSGKLDKSMVSSIHETGTIISTIDPQDEKLSENDIFYEAEMILDTEQFSEQVKCGSQSFDRVDVAGIEQGKWDTDPDWVHVERRSSWIPQEIELSLSATRNNRVKLGRCDIQLAADFAEDEWKKSNLSSTVCRSDAEREISHESVDVKMGLSRKLQKVETSLDATRRFLNHEKSGRTETQLRAESAEEKPNKSSFLSPVRNARRDYRHESINLQTGGSRNLQEVLTSLDATRNTSKDKESNRSRIHLAAASEEADRGDSNLVSLVLRRNADRDSKLEDIDAKMWYSRSMQEAGKSMAGSRYISNIVASDESVIQTATGSVEEGHGKSGLPSSVLRNNDVYIEHGGVGKQMGYSNCRSKVETSLDATRGQFNLLKSTRGGNQLARQSAEVECDLSSLSFSTLKKDANKQVPDIIDAHNAHSRNVQEVETSWAATRNIFHLVSSKRVEAQVTASSILRRNAVCDMMNRNTGQGQPFRLKNGTTQNGFAENGCTLNQFVTCSQLKPVDEDNYDCEDGDREEDDSSDSRSSSLEGSSSDMSVDGRIQNNDDSDEKSSRSSILSTEDSENLEGTTGDEDADDDKEDEVACTSIVQLNVQGFCTRSGYLMQERRNCHLFSRIDCTRTNARKLISKREVII